MDYNATLLSCPLIDDARRYLPRHATKKWRRRDPRALRGVVYHQALGVRFATDLAAFHVKPNFLSSDGLPGASYTLFVEPDGRALLCNDVEDVTWSQGDRRRPGDENVAFMAVCFGGKFSGPGYFYPGAPTTQQLMTAENLWFWLRDNLGFDAGALYGHFDFGKPACPGYSLEALVRRLRDRDANVLWGRSAERQQILKDTGYYAGMIDGMWGPRSAAAMRRFREDHDLPVMDEWGADVEVAFLRRPPVAVKDEDDA
jgi:hypothetical protein